MTQAYERGSRPSRSLGALGVCTALSAIMAAPTARAGEGDPAAASPPAASPPSASPPAPSPPPPQKSAMDAFSAFLDGKRAYEQGDFLAAAHAFEEAYRLTPHPDVLWNAARAWDSAGEPARAANLYQRYLKEAPAGALDRDSALTALNRLAAKLGRIEVVAPGLAEVFVDDQPLAGDRVYVTPGTHVIRGGEAPHRRTTTAIVAAGEAVSVALVDEPKPAAAPVAPPATVIVMPAAAAPAPLLPGWQRAAVGAGLAATAISGGLLLWSGVDTLQARADFDSLRTPQGLADGRAKQTRTNVLLVTTAALGALSLGGGAVLVTMGRLRLDGRAALALDPAGGWLPSLALRGSF